MCLDGNSLNFRPENQTQCIRRIIGNDIYDLHLDEENFILSPVGNNSEGETELALLTEQGSVQHKQDLTYLYTPFYSHKHTHDHSTVY